MKKLFLILLISFFSFNFVQAATANITQVVFTPSSPQSVATGAISEALTIQTQNSGGSREEISDTADLTFTSTSPSGEFLSSTGSAVSTTMSKNSANRSFYYRDSTDGNATITVKVTIRNGGPSWSTSQSITVGAGGDNQNQLSNTDNSGNANNSDDDDENSSENSSSSLSAHEAVSAANSTGLGTRKVSVNAGRKRLASVGAPVEFRATVTGFRENEGSLELLWSFGDGAHAYGRVVRHIYALPGTYQVVLNANQADTNQAVARTSVEVIKPEIKITQATPEFIELKNNSKQEVNLTFWKLKHHSQEFIFPVDTIIAANNSIKLPVGITYLRPDSADSLTLAYPDGQLAIAPKIIPIAAKQDKNNPELALVLNQVKLALQQKQNNSQVNNVNNLAVNTVPEKSSDTTGLQTVKLNSNENNRKSWWQKLFSL